MFVLAIKDLKLFLRDRKAIFLTFLLPIALITLFALAYGGILEKPDPQPEHLLVCDDDSSEFSLGIVQKLDQVEGMDVVNVDTASARDQIRRGKKLAMLYIPTGFYDSIETGNFLPPQLWFDASKAMEASMIQEVVMSILAPEISKHRNQQKVRTYLIERYAIMGPDFIEQLNQDVRSLLDGKDDRAVLSPRPISGRVQVNFGLIQAVAGVAVMMLLFSVAAIGGSILAEKESGTLRRLLVSPIRPEAILCGKLIYALIIALLQLIVMFLFSWLAFGLDIWAAPFSILITILTTALACSSFGIFLASISRTRRQLEGMSTILILIMSALGGSMIPLFFMPRFMQEIAVVSVNYWSIQAFFDIFIRDAGWRDILVKNAILFGIAALLMTMSAVLFRRSLSNKKGAI